MFSFPLQPHFSIDFGVYQISLITTVRGSLAKFIMKQIKLSCQLNIFQRNTEYNLGK